MLDREVVKEFIEEQLEKAEINIPKDTSISAVVETFCQYTEDDYYEWLKDNFKSFFKVIINYFLEATIYCCFITFHTLQMCLYRELFIITFFNHYNPDWDWILGRIRYYSK